MHVMGRVWWVLFFVVQYHDKEFSELSIGKGAHASTVYFHVPSVFKQHESSLTDECWILKFHALRSPSHLENTCTSAPATC